MEKVKDDARESTAEEVNLRRQKLVTLAAEIIVNSVIRKLQ